jgi:hypothetical protein
MESSVGVYDRSDGGALGAKPDDGTSSGNRVVRKENSEAYDPRGMAPAVMSLIT